MGNHLSKRPIHIQGAADAEQKRRRTLLPHASSEQEHLKANIERASVLIFFAGLAMRARRRVAVRARRADDVIEAQKVGDTWVAYGWERNGR